MPTASTIPPGVQDLLAKAGWKEDFSLTSLPGGGNNQAFRVEGRNPPLFLKIYFHDDKDPRERGQTEWNFSSFAWARGLTCLPQPLAFDAARRMAVYEFLAGNPVTCHDLSENHIRQAIEFIRQLNEFRSHSEAARLAAASEACFSIQEHLAQVEGRVRNLEQIETADALGKEALDFSVFQLRPAWNKIKDRIIRAAGALAEKTVPPGARCLSPSDFGFHNAFIDPAGKIRFFDFEYAGWDDPAKLAGDFFSQPKVPVPRSFKPMFIEGLISGLMLSAEEWGRMEGLMPVYGVKWICIMLNEFLPASAARRRFSKGDKNLDQRRQEQLKKAREALERLEI